MSEGATREVDINPLPPHSDMQRLEVSGLIPHSNLPTKGEIWDQHGIVQSLDHMHSDERQDRRVKPLFSPADNSIAEINETDVKAKRGALCLLNCFTRCLNATG